MEPNPNPATPEPTNPNVPKAPPIEIDTGGLHAKPGFDYQPTPQEPVRPDPGPQREQPTEPDVEPGREGT
jgi:hypothetical protein